MSDAWTIWGSAAGLSLLLLGSALGERPWAAPAAGDFETEVRPFLQQHCERCHGEQKQKGGLRLDTLPTDFTDGATLAPWLETIDKLGSGEMPPEGVLARPTPQESARVAQWLAARIAQGEAQRAARGERVSFRRLTREEFAHSIHDLLGVHFEATDLIEDDRWRGFERVGAVQSMSPAHLERTLDALERILLEAYPDVEPEPFSETHSALELLGGSLAPSALRSQGIAERVRVDLWPGQSVRSAPQGGRIDHPGVYRVRVHASGVASQGGRVPHLSVYAESLDRLLFAGDVEAPESDPLVFEFEAHLPAGRHDFSLSNEVPGPPILVRLGRARGSAFVSLDEGHVPWQLQLRHDDGALIEPLLIVDRIEWEGPLASEDHARRERYLPRDVDDPTELRACLGRFLERAYRRPVRASELEPLVSLVEAERGAGSTQRSALRSAMAAALCSQEFLYLVEGSPEELRDTLDTWELAARMSSFLWSTLPDAQLAATARDGSLLEPEVLRSQAARLLSDPRSERLAKSFARQWLELDRVGHFPPDAELYPEYDGNLERSMLRETTGFVAEVLRKNLSSSELLLADWTLVNARLARHYGLPPVRGDHLRRVALEPTQQRSGLLTQAAVLSLTSDGTRHRPVHRGVWLAGVLFDEVPPPPPVNVEPIEPVAAGSAKAGVRAQLEAHVANPSCAACHVRTDPLGFAFENYDAIGRWRTRERVTSGLGEDPPVDASGTLVDGRSFVGARAFQELLLEDRERFGAALTRKLATYALRRPMTVDEADGLARVLGDAQSRGGGLRDLVEALIESELFRGR